VLHVGEALDWSLAVQRLRRMAQESGPSAKIDEIVACSREITKVILVKTSSYTI